MIVLVSEADKEDFADVLTSHDPLKLIVWWLSWVLLFIAAIFFVPAFALRGWATRGEAQPSEGTPTR